MTEQQIALVGYSGHGFVVMDALISQGQSIFGYYDIEERALNPYHLKYLGNENNHEKLENLKKQRYIVGVGNNNLRFSIIKRVGKTNLINAIHKTAILSPRATLGKGIFINAGAIVNSEARIEDGVICNTASIIEHDCKIKECAHIAPGVKLGGNVTIGQRTLIGIGAIILPGVTIGDDCIIGAGSIISSNIANKMMAKGRSQIRKTPNNKL